MKKGIIFLVVIGLTILASNMVIAQEWSAEQKEVWDNVEKFWEISAKGDVDGFLDYFHDDYCGWSNNTNFPGYKTEVNKYAGHYMVNTKTHFFILQPLAIKIHGNVAVVHYLYNQVYTYGEEKEKNENGRWTDIYLKEGDKWLLIGDHGGVTK